MRISIRQFTRMLMAVWFVLLALSLGTRWCAYSPTAQRLHLHIRHGIAERFDHDAEATVPAWYQATGLLFCGLLVAGVAGKRRRDGLPMVRRWWVLATFFMIASLDETAALHETLGYTISSRLHSSIGVYVWIAVGLPLFLLVVWASWRPIAELPAAVRRDVAIAAITYVLGAVVIEALEGYLDPHFWWTWVFTGVTAVEETLEQVGITLFIRGLLTYARDQNAMPLAEIVE